MTNAPRISAVGSDMMDLITSGAPTPNRGKTLVVPDFSLVCGTEGANQTFAAVRPGSDVSNIRPAHA